MAGSNTNTTTTNNNNMKLITCLCICSCRCRCRWYTSSVKSRSDFNQQLPDLQTDRDLSCSHNELRSAAAGDDAFDNTFCFYCRSVSLSS